MDKKRLQLGVNIDHVATLRQARGTSYPDVLEAAHLCEKAGAAGITVHLREDRRHIQDADVFGLRAAIGTRLNLEMANCPEIVAIALEVRPDEVCLVPEKREELTTEGGLDVAGQAAELARTVNDLKSVGIDVSLFVEPDANQLQASAEIGADTVELHTGTYCEAEGGAAVRQHKRLVTGAVLAAELGLRVNAGHGLNLGNIAGILDVPGLDTLNIGHSIVAHAVFVGLDRAVRDMLDAMAAYHGGSHD